MTELSDDELLIEIAKLQGFNKREHLPALWEERNTEDGQDGWDGFYCPRCGCAESEYEKRPCVKDYLHDNDAAYNLEASVPEEKRGEFVRHLKLIVWKGAMCGSTWLLIHSTARQKCDAYRLTMEAKNE